MTTLAVPPLPTGEALVPDSCAFRQATEDDGPVLLELLLCAVNWDGSRPRLDRDEVLGRHELAHYVSGWPRPGDAGIVAVEADGDPVGAAWLRQFPPDDPAYGFVDARTPELSVGVRATHRGRGIGMELCRRMLRVADDAGTPGVSLSVEEANRARLLYQRLGFVVVRDDGAAVTMLRHLPPY